MLNIIIMGSQGAGKGTQAKMLTKKYGLAHIEPGDILRDLSSKKNEIGRKINYYLNVKSILVPTKILIEHVLKPRLSRLDPLQGTIFDGTPRRLREAKLLENMVISLNRKLTNIFYIRISEEETYNRLSKRLTCRKCNKPFILGTDINDIKEKCPNCEGKLFRRKDDTRAGIKNRLEEYNKETKPVIDYFRKRKIFTEINGEQSISKVQKDIVNHIKI